jgi:hypothetical protein
MARSDRGAKGISIDPRGEEVCCRRTPDLVSWRNHHAELPLFRCQHSQLCLGHICFRTDKVHRGRCDNIDAGGLFDHFLPLFKAKNGIDVKVVARPTGQALDTGRRGDADVVFVHAKSAEEKFLSEGRYFQTPSECRWLVGCGGTAPSLLAGCAGYELASVTSRLRPIPMSRGPPHCERRARPAAPRKSLVTRPWSTTPAAQSFAAAS